MKKNKIAVTRRQVLKTGLCAGACMMLPWHVNKTSRLSLMSSPNSVIARLKRKLGERQGEKERQEGEAHRQ